MLLAIVAPLGFLLVQPVPPAPSTPTITLPATLSGEPGSLIAVKADTTSKIITWTATPGATLIQPYPADPACKSMLVHAAAGGTYTLFAAVPNGDAVVAAVCVVTVGPAPVVPPVVPPAPTFQNKLQAAFTADVANDKVTLANAATYALFFRRVSDKANKGTIVYDPTLKTWPQVGDAMKAAVAAIGLPPGSFQRTARVIADNLNPTFGTVTTLDAAMRDQIAAAFLKIADALEALH